MGVVGREDFNIRIQPQLKNHSCRNEVPEIMIQWRGSACFETAFVGRSGMIWFAPSEIGVYKLKDVSKSSRHGEKTNKFQF